MITLGNNFKVCATCAYYDCKRIPDCGINVKLDDGCRGKCHRLLYSGVLRTPLESCSYWRIWPQIER